MRPRSKHRFDLRPETRQMHKYSHVHVVSSTVYCCTIMSTVAAENKYSFLGGRDFFGVSIQIHVHTYMGLPENRNE